MATKSLGTLTLDLIAKIGGFVGPMDQAQRKSKQSMQNITGYAKSAAVAFAAAGVTAGVAAAAMAKSGIDTADALLDISDATGIATEKLSALKYAADIEEISLDKLSTTLNKFSKTVSDAADGVGTGADAFAALGVSVANSDGSLRNSYDILTDVAEAISQLENGADKAAVAQQLFGKSGAQLLPILNNGRRGLQEYSDEAERLNLIISRDTAEASAQFNDNLKKLEQAIAGVGIKLAGDLAPVLADFTDTINDPSTQQGIADLGEGLVKLANYAVQAASGIGEIYRLLNGFDNESLAQIDEQIKHVQDAIANPSQRVRFFGKNGLVEYWSEDELKAEMQKLLEQRKKLIEQSGQKSLEAELNAQGWEDAFSNERPKAFALDKSETDESAKAVDELNKQYQSMVDLLRQQNMLTAEATELEKVRYEFTHGSLKGISDQQKQALEDLARQRDLQIQAEREREDQAEKALQLDRDLLSVKQDLMTEEERYREAAADRLAVLSDALNAGIISEEKYGELVIANTKKLEDQIGKLKDKETELDEFTKNAARSIQSNLSDAIMAGFDGGADDLLDRWKDLLKRMVADAIAADLTRALFGQGALGEGQFGTDQLLKGIGGIFAGLFDAGGTIPTGKVGIVGERGPELVRGPAIVTGRKDTAALLNARGSGIGNITINMPGVTNAQEARKAAGAAAREIIAIVNSSARYT